MNITNERLRAMKPLPFNRLQHEPYFAKVVQKHFSPNELTKLKYEREDKLKAYQAALEDRMVGNTDTYPHCSDETLRYHIDKLTMEIQVIEKELIHRAKQEVKP